MDAGPWESGTRMGLSVIGLLCYKVSHAMVSAPTGFEIMFGEFTSGGWCCIPQLSLNRYRGSTAQQLLRRGPLNGVQLRCVGTVRAAEVFNALRARLSVCVKVIIAGSLPAFQGSLHCRMVRGFSS